MFFMGFILKSGGMSQCLPTPPPSVADGLSLILPSFKEALAHTCSWRILHTLPLKYHFYCYSLEW